MFRNVRCRHSAALIVFSLVPFCSALSEEQLGTSMFLDEQSLVYLEAQKFRATSPEGLKLEVHELMHGPGLVPSEELRSSEPPELYPRLEPTKNHIEPIDLSSLARDYRSFNAASDVMVIIDPENSGSEDITRITNRDWISEGMIPTQLSEREAEKSKECAKRVKVLREFAGSIDSFRDMFLTEESKLKKSAARYIKTCFWSIDDDEVPEDFRSWAAGRIGYLLAVNEDDLGKVSGLVHRCTLTFIDDKRALTASHCVEELTQKQLDDMRIGGFNPNNIHEEPWEVEGVSVIKPGRDLDAKNSTLKYWANDYAYIALKSGESWPYPIRVVGKTNFGDAGAALLFQPTAIAMWVDSGEFEHQETTMVQKLMVDISKGCVVGNLLEGGRYGQHRCQAIPGASGSPIVVLDKENQFNVFGIHTGWAHGTIDHYSSGAPALNGLVVPPKLNN